MNRKKYIALPIMLSLLCINNVYADCTQEAKDEFKEIEDRYKITTTFNSEDKTYTAKIEKANTNKYVYTTAITAQYECKKISDTVTECYGLEPGTTFYAYILGKTNDCDIILREDEIYLKKNNKYYSDPLCKGIEEFALCQEIYDREIDRETFEKRIELYKESIQEKNEQEEIIKQQEKKESFLDKIITYIKENLIQVIIITIFIILTIISIIVMINSSKKSRRLE